MKAKIVFKESELINKIIQSIEKSEIYNDSGNKTCQEPDGISFPALQVTQNDKNKYRGYNNAVRIPVEQNKG
jgi:hypothetical protein